MQTNLQPKKAIVWGQENCQYCDMAKNLLEQNGYMIEERKIGMDEGNWTKEALLRAIPSARSVPQIVIDGNHIGGYPELRKMLAK